MKRLFFIAIIAIFLTVCAECVYAQAPRYPQAKLEKIQGDVKVKRTDADWQKATVGIILDKGDFISTGVKSKAILMMKNIDEVIAITIDEKTETSLEKLLINSLTGKQDSALGLGGGHINVVTRKFDRGTLLKTETPNAIVELGRYGFIVKYKKEPSE